MFTGGCLVTGGVPGPGGGLVPGRGLPGRCHYTKWSDPEVRITSVTTGFNLTYFLVLSEYASYWNAFLLCENSYARCS